MNSKLLYNFFLKNVTSKISARKGFTLFSVIPNI